jgi:hypothetical protein
VVCGWGAEGSVSWFDAGNGEPLEAGPVPGAMEGTPPRAAARGPMTFLSTFRSAEAVDADGSLVWRDAIGHRPKNILAQGVGEKRVFLLTLLSPRVDLSSNRPNGPGVTVRHQTVYSRRHAAKLDPSWMKVQDWGIRQIFIRSNDGWKYALFALDRRGGAIRYERELWESSLPLMPETLRVLPGAVWVSDGESTYVFEQSREPESRRAEPSGEDGAGEAAE